MGFRHFLVGVAVLLVGGLTAFGCVGPAVGPERIDHYQTVAVVGAEGNVEIREVIDWDFSNQSKHGIYRDIPNTGGVPQNVQVESPTAPDHDQFEVINMGPDTRIKIGDPDSTIRGRHRYVITYSLPGLINSGHLAFNAIGTEFPVPIERADVGVLGATLASPRCFTGPYGSTETCDITRSEGGAYIVSRRDLEPNEGITVEGDVASTTLASMPSLPPFDDRESSARWVWAAVVVVIGVVVGAFTYVVSRWIGRNEVAAGGATEAAWGPGVDPAFGGPVTDPSQPPPPVGATRFVADEDMAELAGIDFVPPRGVEPWQAHVVLKETIDNDTVSAWFSSLVARDVVTVTNEGGDITLAPGPAAATADPSAAAILNQALPGGVPLSLGTYNASFANAWTKARTAIGVWVSASGTFRRRPPGHAGQSLVVSLGACGLIPLLFVGGRMVSAVAGGTGLLYTPAAAVALAVLVPGAMAVAVYQRLWRSLSARGSAIALRAESFRRFLHDSEAQHVEWAWQNGLLREYSAWAVALGEAAAWNAAMTTSSIPPAERITSNNVLAPALYASSFSSTTTAPSSSSGGGGGGGGFSGGGGGGGGGGSW